MKRILAIFLLFSALPSFALEPKKDSTDRRVYTNEIGFFQKAERELNDPRFMFHDDKIDMDMGIGGTVGVKGTYTFAGSMYSDSFKPALIYIGSDYSNSFMISPQSCEIHAKARAKLFGHKVIAFIKLQGENVDKFNVTLDQAYLSFDGFSAGLIPSFFNDLEAGVRVDAMSNQQSDVTHPLIGYTFRLNGWEAALSLERSILDLERFVDYGIASNYQPMPDIVLHGKKRWDKGHVQLGAVFRNLTYWKSGTQVQASRSGNGHSFGWGLSLSGNYKPFKSLKLSGVVMGGQGISNYVDILAPASLEMCVREYEMGEFTLGAVPVISTSLMAQYWWMENLSSSFVFQYGHVIKDTKYAIDFDKDIFLAMANIYWYISDFAYLGLEYMFGSHSTYSRIASDPSACAHRVSAVAKFMF